MNVAPPSQAELCARQAVAKAPQLAELLLRQHVDTVQFTHDMTAKLRELIAATAKCVVREYPLDTSQISANTRRATGRIDLFATFHDSSKLALELDRGNKTWSLFKLHHAATKLGAEAVWIRWRGVVKFESVAPVRFVDVNRYGNLVPARAAGRLRRGPRAGPASRLPQES